MNAPFWPVPWRTLRQSAQRKSLNRIASFFRIAKDLAGNFRPATRYQSARTVSSTAGQHKIRTERVGRVNWALLGPACRILRGLRVISYSARTPDQESSNGHEDPIANAPAYA